MKQQLEPKVMINYNQINNHHNGKSDIRVAIYEDDSYIADNIIAEEFWTPDNTEINYYHPDFRLAIYDHIRVAQPEGNKYYGIYASLYARHLAHVLFKLGFPCQAHISLDHESLAAIKNAEEIYKIEHVSSRVRN